MSYPFLGLKRHLHKSYLTWSLFMTFSLSVFQLIRNEVNMLCWTLRMYACSNAFMKYCTLRNAVLSVNLHQHCVLALFFKNNEEEDKYCRKIVTPNPMLPQAKYLSVGQWIVSLREALTFSIVCTENIGQKSAMTQKTQTLSPPVAVIKLDPGCFGSSNFFKFLPSYISLTSVCPLKTPLITYLSLKINQNS